MMRLLVEVMEKNITICSLLSRHAALNETSGRCGAATNVPWSTQGRFAGSSFTDEHDS